MRFQVVVHRVCAVEVEAGDEASAGVLALALTVGTAPDLELCEINGSPVGPESSYGEAWASPAVGERGC